MTSLLAGYDVMMWGISRDDIMGNIIVRNPEIEKFKNIVSYPLRVIFNIQLFSSLIRPHFDGREKDRNKKNSEINASRFSWKKEIKRVQNLIGDDTWLLQFVTDTAQSSTIVR